MTDKTLPPLTAADFEMRWDADNTFPFVESEEATIMAYGHRDKAQLAKLVKQYDTLVEGTEPYEGEISPTEIEHVWAVRTDAHYEVDEGWWITWSGITEETPNAFPVTVIDR